MMSIIIFCRGRQETTPQAIVTASLQAAIEMADRQKSQLSIYFSNTINSDEIIHYQRQAEQMMICLDNAPPLYFFSDLDKLPEADYQQVVLLLFPTIDQAEQLCAQLVKSSDILIAEDTQGKQKLLRLQIDYGASKVCVI